MDQKDQHQQTVVSPKVITREREATQEEGVYSNSSQIQLTEELEISK